MSKQRWPKSGRAIKSSTGNYKRTLPLIRKSENIPVKKTKSKNQSNINGEN